jgi:hypothetical protein
VDSWNSSFDCLRSRSVYPTARLDYKENHADFAGATDNSEGEEVGNGLTCTARKEPCVGAGYQTLMLMLYSTFG